MRTPVSLVTWRQAATRAPASGLDLENSASSWRRTGMFARAHAMRLRPAAASDGSLMREGGAAGAVEAAVLGVVRPAGLAMATVPGWPRDEGLEPPPGSARNGGLGFRGLGGISGMAHRFR